MRRQILTGLLALLWAGIAHASVPNVLHFSGALKSEGAAFTGTMAMTFALYDGAEATEALWSETQSVAVLANRFQILLGINVSFDATTFDAAALHLGITVESGRADSLQAEQAAHAVVRATGTRITYHGLDHLPRSGGAVIAINHTGYVDWLPAALAAENRGRRMRFMIKAEMAEVPVVGWLIRHTKTIPVDRQAGAEAFAAAVQALRDGEIVGVYPEATISRSFELKEFKTGAARMALQAQVPPTGTH